MISTQTQEIQLGFLNNLPDTIIYIYIGSTEGTSSSWYFYDPETDSKTAIDHKAIAGYLQELKISIKEFKNQENQKLDVIIKAEKRYCIRSGLSTNFSRSLLLALATLEREQLQQPIIIAPRPSEGTIFASVYDAVGIRIKAEWDAKTDLNVLAFGINQKLGIETQLPQQSDLESKSSAQPNGNGSSQRSSAKTNGNGSSIQRSIAKSNGNGSKAGASDIHSHPHNVNVRRIRTALGYNQQQVLSWLTEEGYKSPELAPESVIDRFTQTFSVSWAFLKRMLL